MKNAEKIKDALAKSRKKAMGMLNKFCTAEDILAQPESAYAMGELINMYDEVADLATDQAKQIDEMEEMLQNAYNLIKKIDSEIVELRKEVAKAR